MLADRLAARGWFEIQEIAAAVDLWARDPKSGDRVLFEAKTVSRDNEAHQIRAAGTQLHEYAFCMARRTTDSVWS